MAKDSDKTLLDRWPKPDDEAATQQAWSTRDGHLPPDRAFLEQLLTEHELLARKREERLMEAFGRMPSRWFWTWALWSLMIWAITAVVLLLVRT